MTAHAPLLTPSYRRPRARTVLARLALMLGSVLLALGVAEAGVRLIPRSAELAEDPLVPNDGTLPPGKSWFDPDWGAPPPRAFRADSLVGYDHAPSIDARVRLAEHPDRGYRFRTNGHGLRRDAEIEVAKPAGTRRALIVGDSQTSGYGGNHETFPGLLEPLWQARAPDRAVEVLNAGVEGYGPLQLYLWVREHGLRLSPDLVVVALYAGNDLSDLAYPKLDSAIPEDDAGLVGPVRAPWTWIGLRSELVARLQPPMQERLREPLAQVGIAAGRPRPPAPPAGLDPLVRLLRECHGCWFQSLQQAVRARLRPAEIDRADRRLELLLRTLATRANAGGSRLVVLVIPTKSQVEPRDEAGAFSRAARLLQLTDEDLRYDDVAHVRMLDAARRAGVVALDPLPDLREAATRRRLYYRRDWHLNPDGNRALAAFLDRALGGTGLADAEGVPVRTADAGAVGLGHAVDGSGRVDGR